MRLRRIDKARYDKHFKLTFLAVVLVLLVVALAVSTLLIFVFGQPGGSNFWLNVAGVLVAAFTVVALFARLRQHPFLTEVIYVWDVKQVLNRIFRKQKAIKAAIEQGDRNAMILMNYHYKASRQIYELDNNTITMNDLTRAENDFQAQMAAFGVTVSVDEFDPALIDRY